MVISVKRGGVTSRYWSGNGSNISVESDKFDKVLSISFSISSKGGGETSVCVFIDGESFNQVAAHMMRADRDKAIKAFGTALLEGS